jgi:hypothetical protein
VRHNFASITNDTTEEDELQAWERGGGGGGTNSEGWRLVTLVPVGCCHYQDRRETPKANRALLYRLRGETEGLLGHARCQATGVTAHGAQQPEHGS